ncbi:hypothetical protein HAX54_001843, partial [Datura stramonium]|nr:hypothetical protein [Datura stramonium]
VGRQLLLPTPNFAVFPPSPSSSKPLFSIPKFTLNLSNYKVHRSAMLMLVNCSNCRTPLQLPPGARSIRCAICQAVTQLADPRAAPPPPPNQYQHPPPATSA